VCAVFSAPSTHRTLQFKSPQSRVDSLDAQDRRCAKRYVSLFGSELGALGFSAAFTQALLSGADDLTVVGFIPQQVFDQTPGPRAGAPLRSADTV